MASRVERPARPGGADRHRESDAARPEASLIVVRCTTAAPEAPRRAADARLPGREPGPVEPPARARRVWAFVDRVVGTFWWQLRFPDLTLDRVPRLRPGNGARQAFYATRTDGTHTITLPRRYRTKGVVLHELAHWAHARPSPTCPHHGRTFTRLLLDATEEFCGPERASELAASFDTHRVHVGHPPMATLDGRLVYGEDERLHLDQQRRRRVGADPA